MLTPPFIAPRLIDDPVAALAQVRTVYIEATMLAERRLLLRDRFDLPDLYAMDDGIANGTFEPGPGEPGPLALFTAPRVDYSLHRLRHYTATASEHLQNFVLFTNYQFYIDKFVRLGHALMSDPDQGGAVTDEMASAYAALRVALGRSGRPIPANDAWIAALALQHRLPVLSRDQHFDAVPNLQRQSW